jgi:choline dehydrogenase-like flavoprotein
VLAARLSEDPGVSVCVLEAGPPDTVENIHIPMVFGQLFKTQVDWDFSTAPEPFCDSRRIYLPRGKTYGGSSSLNAMIYIRGNRLDYDDWAAGGAQGVELRRPPAVLQARRGLRARRERVPRGRAGR